MVNGTEPWVYDTLSVSETNPQMLMDVYSGHIIMELKALILTKAGDSVIFFATDD